MNTQCPAIVNQLKFKPPFCPNPDCLEHVTPKSGFYTLRGWARTKKYPHFQRRYRCQRCRRCFSYSYFKLDYRQRKPRLNAKIFYNFTSGLSNRHTARGLDCSEHMIRRRLIKMAQWMMVFHTKAMTHFKINELICFDGLENFAKSQYDPNHIQHAVGVDSLFVYDFNFAPLNRKGRTTPKQKLKQKKIEEKEGPYPPSAIRQTTKKILKRLYDKTSFQQLRLVTDEHFQYERAIRELKPHNISQQRVNSKIARNYVNPLFSVNHTDLLIRHHIGAFKRQTIAFSKTAPSMIQKYALFMGWKNYVRPIFVKPHKANPTLNKITPAMQAGVTRKRLGFHRIFERKETVQRIQLNDEWMNFHDAIPTVSRTIAA